VKIFDMPDFDPSQKRKNYFNKFGPKPENKDIVFGIQSVLETIRAGKEIDKILVQRELGSMEVLEFARLRGIPVQKVPTEKLDRVTRKNHQGVIAFVSSINYAKLDVVVAGIYEKGEVPLLLVLDRITDVRNFGAIARTAECAGVHAIVIPTKGAAQINADAMKTSSGALNFLPVCREEDLKNAVVFLQESGLQVVACTEKADEDMYKIDFDGPTAIVMGSEEDGISEDILRITDTFATIPQFGRVGSLNVSVACGVMLYEAVRKRGIA
jgi:23S rRNA (guanosine2251-2'-O)-methyltransferase